MMTSSRTCRVRCKVQGFCLVLVFYERTLEMMASHLCAGPVGLVKLRLGLLVPDGGGCKRLLAAPNQEPLTKSAPLVIFLVFLLFRLSSPSASSPSSAGSSYSTSFIPVALFASKTGKHATANASCQLNLFLWQPWCRKCMPLHTLASPAPGNNLTPLSLRQGYKRNTGTKRSRS